MNKSDIKLIAVLIVTFIFLSLILNINTSKGNVAQIYFNDKLIKTVDLKKNDSFIVEGFNGPVKIIVKNNKIKVVNEDSPNHICSKQGYISSSYETIVCLPNKIVIKIIDNNKIDTKVG